MSFAILNQGENNLIEIGRPQIPPKNCKIVVRGNNNRVVIGENGKFQNFSLSILGDDHVVHIGRDAIFKGHIALKHKGSVSIGDGSSSEKSAILAVGARIEIGADCMFAAGTEIRTSDSHFLYDLDTGKRINPDRPITIGDHVWFGKNVTVLKGARIGGGSMVALGSIVTRGFPKCSLLAGTPAKLVRSRVSWTRYSKSPLPKYDDFDELTGF